jgi:PPK2 family polyphosphate:nucleotide phosphotransferase
MIMKHNNYIVAPGDTIKISEQDPSFLDHGISKKEGKKVMKKNRKAISELQDKFFAYGRYSLLLVFQALDAAGKDSTVKHVLGRVRPQGIRFVDFLPPSKEEQQHDYLWRIHKHMPERGMINIFHRSYYEDVTATRVHPEYILEQKLPGINSLQDISTSFWSQRYRQINDFEQMLAENGTIILKFFLNVSETEQSKRFLKRLRREDKHWKFSEKDIEEQKLRPKYLDAYEKAINHTVTGHAPWHIIPADRKWFMRYLVSEIILDKMKTLDLVYPDLSLSGGNDPDEIRKSLNEKIQ